MYEKVQEHCGQTLQHSHDLQTSACCDEAPPHWLTPIPGNIQDKIRSRYYGGGLVLPPLLEGARIPGPGHISAGSCC